MPDNKVLRYQVDKHSVGIGVRRGDVRTHVRDVIEHKPILVVNSE